MKSARMGRSTWDVEITDVSAHGIRVSIGERELFASFTDFPWFEEASSRELVTVERPSPNHLFWPELDVDLAVDSLEHPDRYPLVSRRHPGSGSRHGVE